MTVSRGVLLGIILYLMAGPPLHAQSVVLRASTTGSGAGIAANSSHRLQSTLGVPSHTSIPGNTEFLHGVGFWFAARSTDTVLPVELTAFTAQMDGAAVLLTWQTASETNNAGFDVQRQGAKSPDGWETLAFVEGAGTTSELQTYRYRVTDADVGPYHFRLKQVDIDGAFTFSDEVRIMVRLTAPYRIEKISPHPIRERATVELSVQEAQVVRATLYDLLGRRVALPSTTDRLRRGPGDVVRKRTWPRERGVPAAFPGRALCRNPSSNRRAVGGKVHFLAVLASRNENSPNAEGLCMGGGNADREPGRLPLTLQVRNEVLFSSEWVPDNRPSPVP